jgi:hypothetical protein
MSNVLYPDPIGLLDPDSYYLLNIQKISEHKFNRYFIIFNDFLLICHNTFFSGHKNFQVGRIRSRTLIISCSGSLI